MVTPVTAEVTATETATALLWSVEERAVTATVFWAGTAGGAVKVVVAPLAVWAGEKLPQLIALLQVAIQSTPALAGSLFTEAETCADVATCSVLGGICCSAMDMRGVCEGGVWGRPVEHPARLPKVRRAKASEVRA